MMEASMRASNRLHTRNRSQIEKGFTNVKDKEVSYAYMYRRISSLNQVGNNSLNAQEEAIRQYAKEHNIEIVGDYVDSAKTGTTMKNRDEFCKMLEDIKKNPKIKMILVHHFDRSNRNARDQLNVIYTLALQGISIRSTDGLDSMNPDDMPDILDEAVTAQKLSIRLKDETMKGLKINAEKMEHNGGLPPTAMSSEAIESSILIQRSHLL